MQVDFLGKDGFDASTIVSPVVYNQLQEYDESFEREDFIKTEEGVQENRADMRWTIKNINGSRDETGLT